MRFKQLTMLLLATIIGFFAVHNPASASTTFQDVSKSSSAYEEINFLVGKKVISGYEQNGKLYFKPNNFVTRGQAAKMVVVATGNTGLKVQTSSFDDIKTTQEVSLYAERVLSKGWFQYTSGKDFSPNMVVSRMEMAKIISNAYGLDVKQYADVDLPFKDVEKSSIYYKYIAAVYYNGITRGKTTTTFDPKSGVTRSQFASFVARATSTKYRLSLPLQGVGVPDASKALGEAIVTTDGLNVRSSANFAANNIIGQLNEGDKVKYYEATSSYFKIDYKGEYAYISRSYAKIAGEAAEKPSTSTPKPTEPATPPAEEKPVVTATTGIATVNDLSVRKGASSSSKRVGSIQRGDKLPVHSVTGNWAKVTYKGETAYVHKTYLRLKNNSGSAVKGRIIVLDPGHGGKDGGATSISGVSEKTIVLNVALKTKKLLEAQGAIVKMTRSNDTFVELENRPQYALNQNGEIFVSIHANAATASADGAETFVSISNNENTLEDQALAKFVNDEIVKNADMRNRGVKKADYLVIRKLVMPSILIELGFVSNKADEAKLISEKYQTIYAESIYNGIMKYYAR